MSDVVQETPKLKCRYSEGMFAQEKYEDIDDELGLIVYNRLRRELLHACYHEAGHAVLAYALGRPIAKFGVARSVAEIDDKGSLGMSFGGFCGYAPAGKASNDRFNGPYCHDHFAFGVYTAAGPAAERKSRLIAGSPLRLLGGTIGDNAQIERMAKFLERNYRRDSYAVQEHVWRHAQKALEIETIWEAVTALGEALCDKAEWEWDTEAEETEENGGKVELGERWTYLDPPKVHGIFRRVRLRRGMLLPTGPQSPQPR